MGICFSEVCATNITAKIGSPTQVTALRIRQENNTMHWLYITHHKTDGSDITLPMIKEHYAKEFKWKATHVVCRSSSPYDRKWGTLSSVTMHTNLKNLLFETPDLHLVAYESLKPYYEDGVYERPPLGIPIPEGLKVKDWKAEHVLWWLEKTVNESWLAGRFAESQERITGEQLLYLSELSLRDFGMTNPRDRINLLTKIRQLSVTI